MTKKPIKGGRRRHRATELRIRLEGTDAELGLVPAADIAQLILALEKSLARAAAVVLGRPSRRPGRREHAIDQASHLRLVGVEPGSVVPIFELPHTADKAGPLDLDAAHLSELAAMQIVDVLSDRLDGHPYVVESLWSLGKTLGIGDRYDSIVLEVRDSGRASGSARLDSTVRRRLLERVRADRSAARLGMLLGTLVEADFEAFTARLRSPEGQSVAVSFDPSMADDIHRALREQASAEGWITYDPSTSQAKAITIHTVRRADQLALNVDARAFRERKSFADLQREQGVTGIFDLEEIYDSQSSKEDLDAYADALESLRRA